MDVFDPVLAPGVANPEPGGIYLWQFLESLKTIHTPLIGFDVVEVTPEYDFGVTSILASKIIFELICSSETRRFNTACRKR